MEGEEGRRRSSTGMKAEKGKANGPLVEALGCEQKEKSQWEPQSEREQVAK